MTPPTTLSPSDVSHFLTADETDARFQALAQIVNVAICEWLGFKNIIAINGQWVSVLLVDDGEGSVCDDVKTPLPSHTHGLCALGHVHEAEKGLTEEQRWDYMAALGKETCFTWSCCHGTSRDRCIALLRVVRAGMFT